jgi:hypothetical protein
MKSSFQPQLRRFIMMLVRRTGCCFSSDSVKRFKPGEVLALVRPVYLRTEANGVVTGRAKLMRPEFVEKIRQSEHWQHRAMVPNELTAIADLWS